MSRILITSGPTRQYLDPVRYLTNSSSGKMGCALAEAALALGHEVIVVTGPVELKYPSAARVHHVLTTDEMLFTCQREFPQCDGLIGAAAPCDYKPISVSEQKLSKTGESLKLELWETPDVVATLGATKRKDQWTVGFALETEDPHFRAITKLERKSCDLIVLNGPDAMTSNQNSIELLNPQGIAILKSQGSKREVAEQIMAIIEQKLITTSEVSSRA
jgi:phosphopantothenoylcysteine decarboxylase/phosphopantothenate--cysteine ligase